ncbi:MAG: Gfo/Idh/MocA family oxidoreductase [bacterium]|nr:Gfo/Idh/MocA family oxidoreductase [bacterium]
MKKSALSIGVIGCGNISGIYCRRIKEFPVLSLAACADLDRAKAEARANEFNIPTVLSPDELLLNPSIDIILNLTTPQAHYTIARRALEAGKHVYNEKPLCVELHEAKTLLKLARKHRRLIACAPDTFLGAGLQTCRKLIDDGVIGTPVAATAFMMCHGHESWHPNPEFYYQHGGGPMLDMGPYYLTALVSLLGPVARVCGSASISFPTRTITSQPKAGTLITVETPTHIQAVLEFASGACATIITSFDVWGARLPFIEIYGSLGTLSCPDPNTFGGPVKLYVPGKYDWAEVPLIHGYAENYRGLGLADLASAIRDKRPARANGDLALHVLEVMHAAINAGRLGKYIKIKSSCARPAPLSLNQNHSL